MNVYIHDNFENKNKRVTQADKDRQSIFTKTDFLRQYILVNLVSFTLMTFCYVHNVQYIFTNYHHCHKETSASFTYSMIV